MENNIQEFIDNILAAAERAVDILLRENRVLVRELDKIHSDGYLPDMLYDTIYEIVDFLDISENLTGSRANA